MPRAPAPGSPLGAAQTVRKRFDNAFIVTPLPKRTANRFATRVVAAPGAGIATAVAVASEAQSRPTAGQHPHGARRARKRAVA